MSDTPEANKHADELAHLQQQFRDDRGSAQGLAFRLAFLLLGIAVDVLAELERQRREKWI